MSASKTSFIIIGTVNAVEKASSFTIRINNEEIRPQKHLKILGVEFDQTLTWERHISSVARRTNAIIISLFKIRSHLSNDILKILVQTHVLPHLQYCLSVWGGATRTRLNRLQKVINFAARLVSGLRRGDHVSPALATFGWPDIDTLVMRRDAINIYRALHDPAAPQPLKDMARPRQTVCSRRTRATAAGAAVLAPPRLQLTTARRLFPYRAAVSWNKLSRVTTLCTSRRQLMTRLEQ